MSRSISSVVLTSCSHIPLVRVVGHTDTSRVPPGLQPRTIRMGLRGHLILVLLLVVATTAYQPRCGRDRPQLRHGRYVLHDVQNNVIKAICDDGFELVGSELRFCNPSTGYSGDPPSCQDVDECKLFEQMRANAAANSEQGSGERGSGDRPDEAPERQPCHANATCTNIPYRYKCTCNEGFYGNGHQCSVLTCPVPVIPNASVRKIGYGNILFITCPEYHILIGYRRPRCNDNTGKWQPAPARCLRLPRCPEPIPMDHGRVYYKSQDVYLLGTVVGVMCRDGYSLRGPGTWRCGSGFVWEGQTDTYCEKMGIHRMGDALRAKLDRAAKNSASTIEYNEHARFVPYHPKGVNIVFLIDVSSSMLTSHIRRGIEFFSLIIRDLHSLQANDYNTTGITRFAAVSFADEAKEEFGFDATAGKTAKQTIKMLKDIETGGGGTNLKAGLQKASRVLNFAPAEIRDAMHILFTLSDGEADTMEGVELVVDGLRDVERFVLGVGAFARRNQLATIASSPVYDHLFMLEDFNELTRLTNYIIDTRNQSQKCGLAGKPTDDKKLSKWPWNVLVKAWNSTGTNYCGGSLICSNWVITSAQCLTYKQKVKVTLGINGHQEETSDRLEVEVANVIKYPGYNPTFPHVHDLALLYLGTPVPLSRTARTVCTPHEHSEEVQTMKPWTVDYVKNTGWGIKHDSKTRGRSFNLHEDKTQFKSSEDCRAVLNSINITDSEHQKELGCLSSQTEDCSGDVGGPVVWASDDEQGDTDTEYHLVAIPTFNSNCHSGGYTVVTKLGKYLNWIWETTGQCPGIYGAKRLAPP